MHVVTGPHDEHIVVADEENRSYLTLLCFTLRREWKVGAEITEPILLRCLWSVWASDESASFAERTWMPDRSRILSGQTQCSRSMEPKIFCLFSLILSSRRPGLAGWAHFSCHGRGKLFLFVVPLFYFEERAESKNGNYRSNPIKGPAVCLSFWWECEFCWANANATHPVQAGPMFAWRGTEQSTFVLSFYQSVWSHGGSTWHK